MTSEPEAQQPSCGHGSPALSIDEAHERIAATVRPVQSVELVNLRAALGRVLAEDIASPVRIPPDTNSAMDGYAFRGEDLNADGAAFLRVLGTAWAGHPFDREVGRGECVRIMTGAPIPVGADSVVMQERTELEDEQVRIRGARAGDNVRFAGEDLEPGAHALDAGTWVHPAELGVLASLGLTAVKVIRRPRVALFATGDELLEPGQPLRPGTLYDSNRYTVWGMLTRLGMEIDDRGHLPDDRSAVEASLASAAAENDVVITTGGVSVGEADHIGAVLREQAEVGFWQVAIKPGRPLTFGHLGAAAFFGLPGNPVSAMVTFYQLVQPALRFLAGAPYRSPVALRARSTGRFGNKPGRTEFQRAVLSRGTDGLPEVAPAGPQGSGRLTSMARANCFAVLTAEREGVERGDWVDVQPFEGMVG
ncbi:MAG: gephyrin-like molybdotransferase Glp [Halofilum sp. (in: g-proteobacteria)]